MDSGAFSGSSMLDVEFAQLSDPGKVRDHNEDCVGYCLPQTPKEARAYGWIFALADGVGGQDRGEVASRSAIETLTSGLHQKRAEESTSHLLQSVMQTANQRVHELAAATDSSMCTTTVACALRGNIVTIAHVGDSRCYLIRRDGAVLLTRDHTLVNEQVTLGLLSDAEAAVSESRHLLSRSLGANKTVDIDIVERQIVPGDVLLLSSDGLHASVTSAEIGSIVANFHDLKEAAKQLVSLARDKDGSDNISVQLIRVRNVERMGVYRGRPYKLH